MKREIVLNLLACVKDMTRADVEIKTNTLLLRLQLVLNELFPVCLFACFCFTSFFLTKKCKVNQRENKETAS